MEPLTVTIEFETGFSIRSGYGLAGILDGVILRDPDGLPYIPGTTLKGIIRQACVEISQIKAYPVYADVVSELKEIRSQNKDPNDCQNHSKVTRIFGTPFCPPLFEFTSAFLEIDDPEESAILKMTAAWNESHNSICLETGTAFKDHLFTNEIAAGNRHSETYSNYRFRFEIIPRQNSIPDDLNDLISFLICGIRFADRLGANKSRGKGVVEMSVPTTYNGKSCEEWINITFPSKETVS